MYVAAECLRDRHMHHDNKVFFLSSEHFDLSSPFILIGVKVLFQTMGGGLFMIPTDLSVLSLSKIVDSLLF